MTTPRHSAVKLVAFIGLALTALQCPPASALASEPGGAKRPNILIAIADDWSYGHAGAYGCRWVDTPAFDRVAREGVHFKNAFTNNPKCSPCRASLLTGRNSWQLDEACNHFGVFPARWAVYPDLLERAGYHVGFTGKGWGPGDFRAGGFKRNPAGPKYNRHTSPPPHRGVEHRLRSQLRRPSGGTASPASRSASGMVEMSRIASTRPA